LRVSFGIEGGKLFSTATFRAGALFICTRGQNPGLSPVVPSGQKSVWTPVGKIEATPGRLFEDEDENEAPDEV